MSDSRDAVPVLIDGDAIHLAFKIGRAAQRLIMDRALELAQSEADSQGQASVTTDHVRRAIGRTSLQEAWDKIDADCDDAPKTTMVA